MPTSAPRRPPPRNPPLFPTPSIFPTTTPFTARAKSRLDCLQERQVAHLGEAPDVGQYVVQVGDAEIRHAEGSGGHAAAGKVDRLVADALRHQRVIRADRANDLERALLA